MLIAPHEVGAYRSIWCDEVDALTYVWKGDDLKNLWYSTPQSRPFQIY